MDRRQWLIVGGSLSGVLLLYCISFGPIVYVWGTAMKHGLVPTWLDDGLSVLFHPHMRCMYYSESYYDYIFWFAERATGNSGFSWQEFRANQEQHDG